MARVLSTFSCILASTALALFALGLAAHAVPAVADPPVLACSGTSYDCPDLNYASSCNAWCEAICYCDKTDTTCNGEPCVLCLCKVPSP